MDKWRKKLLKVALLLVATFCFFAFIIFPNFIRTGGVDQSAWCKNNIRQLDASVEQWALENKLTNGTVILTNQIVRYLAHGEIPKCPIGGEYILTKVGITPICSKPASEHKLTR
jgi:hypothetical protein